MDHDAFFQRLRKNDLSGLFLFHGEEEYIKSTAIHQLIDLIDPAARDLNLAQLRAPLFQAVQEAAQTLPFFSDRRLIIAYDMPDSELKLALQNAEDIPQSTTLLLVMRGACKANIVELAHKRDVLFHALTERDAARFIEKRARERGASISSAAIQMLVEMVGTDTRDLLNEFSKAADYAGENNEITADILRACVTPHSEYEYFQMLDQLLSGQKREAVRALKFMLQNDQGAAFKLPHAFVRELKNMLAARLLLDGGEKEANIATRMHWKQWTARTALRGAKRISADTLRKAVLAFASVDYLQISGKAPADQTLEASVLKFF